MTESEKLFLACLRFFFSKKQAAKELRQSLNRRYVNKIDWNLFLSLAELHGVIPLLYHSLNAVAWTNIPDIDILIRKKDLKKAEKEMLRFGYHRPHSIGKDPFPENSQGFFFA